MGELVWQMHDAGEWRFGRMVRGVVREPYYVEIYYDAGQALPWVWLVRLGDSTGPRGAAGRFGAALDAAEVALRAAGLIGPEDAE